MGRRPGKYNQAERLERMIRGLKIAQDAVCEALGINDNRITEIHLYKHANPLNLRLSKLSLAFRRSRMKLPILAVMLVLILAPVAWAEVRAISATGEYRMGDNDTKMDAKRLALQDAKRLALEKAGTYLESITEVKNFQLGRDELRAYTAGIVEVTEQATRSTMEGETTVVRVDVTCRVDTAVIPRQIDALRKNESAKADLLHLQEDADRWRKEAETKTKELASLKSKAEVEAVTRERQQMMAKADVDDLLARADAALFGPTHFIESGSSTPEVRTYVKRLMEQVYAHDPSNAEAHNIMGTVLREEGDLEGALREFRSAVRFDANVAMYHLNLGHILAEKGDLESAIKEFRIALRLRPNMAEPYIYIGYILLKKGDWDGAITESRMALKLDPNGPNSDVAHSNLGWALYRRGDRAGAIAELREALRINPDYQPARKNLEIVLGNR